MSLVLLGGLRLIEGGLAPCEQAGELLGTLGHPEVLRGRPLINLGSGKGDPTFDALEHLDLECCEEH